MPQSDFVAFSRSSRANRDTSPGGFAEEKSTASLTTEKVPEHVYWILLTVTCFAILLRFSLSTRIQVMNVDAVDYFKLGATLTDYFSNFSAFWSPLYPLLSIVLDYTMHDLETSSKIVSAFAGGILVPIVYAITNRLFGQAAGILAALLVGFNPVLIYYSLIASPEMTYLVFYFGAVNAFYAWLSRQSFLLASLSGVLTGLAYLTRPEGAFLFGLLSTVFLGLAIERARKHQAVLLKRTLKSLVAYGCTVLVISFPYAAAVNLETNQWTLSPRSSFNLPVGIIPDDQLLRLSEDKSRILPRPQPTLSELLVQAPGKVAKKYASNVGQFVDTVAPQLFLSKPLFYLSLIFLLTSGWIARARLPEYLTLVGSLAPLLIVPFYFVEVRVCMFVLPCFLIAAAGCVVKLAQKIPHFEVRLQSVSSVTGKWESVATLFLVTASIAAVDYMLLRPRVASKGSYGIDHKIAGLWLGGLTKDQPEMDLPREQKVLARKPWVAFYARATPVLIPHGSISDILRFAKANKIDYLVVDDLIGTKERPALREIAENTPDGLRLLYDNLGIGEHRVRVFRFEAF
jgi:hypothetical protein